MDGPDDGRVQFVQQLRDLDARLDALEFEEEAMCVTQGLDRPAERSSRGVCVAPNFLVADG